MIRQCVYWGTAGFLILTLIVMIPVAGCDEDASSVDDLIASLPEIDMESAETVLTGAIMAAESHDLEKLCGFGDNQNMCQQSWDQVEGWDSLPSEPPEITDSYSVPHTKYEDGSWSTGGQVLVLEGFDGNGRHYRTEFLVFFDPHSEKIVALNPIYWSGTSIVFPDKAGHIDTMLSPTQKDLN